MKKIIILFLAFIVGIINVNAVKLDTYSKNVLLYNLSDEMVVYEENALTKTPIASLTKVMTALVVLDYIDDLNASVSITSADLKGLAEENASVAGFSVGEKVTYQDLLYGLLLPSGADAAQALVHNTYKTESKFIEKMNELADKFQLKNTHFSTPTGLDTDGNYSTVTDLMFLLKEALKNEIFNKIFTSSSYTTSNSRLKFESTFKKIEGRAGLNLDFIIGSKTGTTDDAGLCLISLAKHDEKEYILVTTQAPFSYTVPYNLYDAKLVYNYFFNNYDFITVFNEGDVLINLEAKNSLSKNVDITAAAKTELYLPKTITREKMDYKYNSILELKYNTKPGTKIGTLDIMHDGVILKTIDVILNQKLHYNYFILLFYIVIFIIIIIFIKKSIPKSKRNSKK